MTEKKKVYIHTWGCQMNEYDSARLVTLLEREAGFEATSSPESADLLLLNTCSIREKAQEKLFHQLGRWRALKARRAGVLIGVGGCVATQEGELIRARAPYVDILFGPQTLHRLPSLIARAQQGEARVSDLSFPAIEKFDALPAPISSQVAAAVTIMEGCNKYCTYCVVPYTRGPEVSRPLEDVLEEVRQLTAQGSREITLLGQNVNAWREATVFGTRRFSDLLRAVAQLPGVFRLRFLTSHPGELTEDVIEVYRDTPNLASFLHLPVQSGSDVILSAMGRGHTGLEYKSIIRKLRAARPDIEISSDFIVGFPGEGEEEFLQTLRFIETVDFDVSYSFLYSPRPGTPAAMLEDPTPLNVKQVWLARLQSLVKRQVARHTKAMIGRAAQVLFESIDARGAIGRTPQQRTLRCVSSEARVGSLAWVNITGLAEKMLVGDWVSEATVCG